METFKEAKHMAEEGSKNPGFIKGYLYGFFSVLTIIITIFATLGVFVFKEVSVKEVVNYIVETENNKKEILKLNEKFLNANQLLNQYKTEKMELINEIALLKEENNKTKKVKELIADYKKMYLETSYYSTNGFSVESQIKYRLMTYAFTSIEKQIEEYAMERDFLYFIVEERNRLNLK